MEFPLSTSQIIACVIVAAAAAILVNWIDYLIERRRPVESKVTVRLLGSAVAAEPGDFITIALSETVSDEYHDHITNQLSVLTEMGIKVGIVENATGIAVARGRQDD